MTERFTIGDAPKRREDARFVTGHGRYLDDLRFDDLSHAVLVRSPHAHARIDGIDVSAALAAPGVLAVLTAADVDADGLHPLRPTVEANVQTGEPFAFLPQPLLAAGKVRFAGEPVALVVADTRARAMDAAELVEIAYAALPAVTDADAARAFGAPEVAAEVPGNVCLNWRTGNIAAAEAAFAAAAHVVRLRLDNHRIVTNPMEPRGLVGLYDPEADRYTAYVSSQNIHLNRDNIAKALGRPPSDVRFIAPDVGGGFGAKNFIYAEQALMLWAARRVGRPVKWIASRSEVFLSDHQARDHRADAALALDAGGRFLALRVESVANIGAYMAGGSGAVQTFQYVHLPGTVYAIPAIDLTVAAVVTNTAPADRRGGAPGWFRSGRVAADEHGAGGRDADDHRLRAGRGQRRFSRHVRPGAGAGRCGRISGAARGERGAGEAAWPGLRLPHQGDRRIATRERGYPFRDRRHRVPDHRHADDRPGA